jgi:hypothetical protein
MGRPQVRYCIQGANPPARRAGRGKTGMQGTAIGGYRKTMSQRTNGAARRSAGAGPGALYLERQGRKRFAGAKPREPRLSG